MFACSAPVDMRQFVRSSTEARALTNSDVTVWITIVNSDIFVCNRHVFLRETLVSRPESRLCFQKLLPCHAEKAFSTSAALVDIL